LDLQDQAAGFLQKSVDLQKREREDETS